MRPFLLPGVVLASVVVLSVPGLGQVGQAGQANLVGLAGPGFSSTLPVAFEHRYRMAARIRPLLLFWVGRDNVGGARIQWRRGADGSRGWELLIGSDPGRAPAHVNRWGYIREETTGADVSMLGVMKQSDEQSLAEARSRADNESRSGYVYKLIRTRVSQGESSAVVTTSAFPRDYTYRDLPALLRGFQSQPVRTGVPKQVRITQSAKPGFLVAIADLIHDSVNVFHRSGASGLTRRAVAYAYNGQVYDLVLAPPRVLKNARYGDRTYATLLVADFEVLGRTGRWKEQFSVAYGTDGAIEEVPVYIAYQPRWWFKVELLLDESERF